MRAVVLFMKGDSESTFIALKSGSMCISEKLAGKKEAQKYVENL